MAFLKNIWKVNTKHHKLSEELALQNAKETENDPINDDIIDDVDDNNEDDIITFKLKYLGSTVVEKINGDNINTESVKNIIKVAKASRKKLQRVNITISLKGIVVSDLQGNDLFKISIYRISNCSTDSTHRQVFSFVSTDENETMECHAFFCSKRKTAETVTLAVAKAFSAAYEHWRILPNTNHQQKTNKITTIDELKQQIVVEEEEEENIQNNTQEEKLIDFESDNNEPLMMVTDGFLLQQKPVVNDCFNTQWVCFDDDFVTATHKNDVILA